MCDVSVTTAVNRYAAYDGIFLMKAEHTPKQVRSNILKKNKRCNAIIQCTVADSADCQWQCVHSVLLSVSVCAQCLTVSVSVCTVSYCQW